MPFIGNHAYIAALEIQLPAAVVTIGDLSVFAQPICQVYWAAKNFGTTYQSSNLIFGEGDD